MEDLLEPPEFPEPADLSLPLLDPRLILDGPALSLDLLGACPETVRAFISSGRVVAGEGALPGAGMG